MILSLSGVILSSSTSGWRRHKSTNHSVTYSTCLPVWSLLKCLNVKYLDTCLLNKLWEIVCIW